MSDTLAAIKKGVIEGSLAEIEALTRRAIEEQATPQEILDVGLMPGMERVGVQFREGNMYVPEVLRSSRTMQLSMGLLKPLMVRSEVRTAGKVVIGTVEGDIHDIGKSLVRMMMEGAGFEVVDLGKSVEPRAFVEAVRREKPQIVGMSALLTTTVRAMAATIQALEAAGLRSQVKVVVGGAPVTEEYARQLGADGYGANAPAAVELARKLHALA